MKGNSRNWLMYFIECMRRKLRVNAGKSKVMVFEGKEVEVLDFSTQYV